MARRTRTSPKGRRTDASDQMCLRNGHAAAPPGQEPDAQVKAAKDDRLPGENEQGPEVEPAHRIVPEGTVQYELESLQDVHARSLTRSRRSPEGRKTRIRMRRAKANTLWYEDEKKPQLMLLT